jgi:carboxylesterase type B
MFWIFGGDLEFGTGSVPGYDSSKFAAFEDTIIVTFNYRTNGTLPHSHSATHHLLTALSVFVLQQAMELK